MLSIKAKVDPRRSAAVDAIGLGPEGVTVAFRSRYGGESPWEYVFSGAGEEMYRRLADGPSLGVEVQGWLLGFQEPVRVKRHTYLP